MDPQFRSRFNAAYTPEIHARYSAALSDLLDTEFEFRLAETPVFLPDAFRTRTEEAARAIVRQLSDPHRIEPMKRAVPERWDTPGMDKLPSMAQVDFAVVMGKDGELEPKLIELQGFPSLSAFQVVQHDAWQDELQQIPGLDRKWSCWFSDLDREGYLELARRTILGDHAPEEVILMDIDPPSQKTWPDFAATKLLFDVDPVAPTDLIVQGRRLWRVDPDGGGKLIPVHRIYNRVVFDELSAKNLAIPFDYRDELEVEWVPHPNWYWIWSKFSLPFLEHPSVPKATFVSELREPPADLRENYVLKPLFSFAGGGVNVDPTPEDIESIPDEERGNWCIQEKIAYAPALEAADGGGVKVEIRMMFLRPDDASEMILTQNLCRLSRGKMLGVDFNKDFTWVGSSIGLYPV